MEIGQIEAFLAVDSFGGFRQAAKSLNLTQPAVSARIKALETSLGATLLDRGRRLALSAAGRSLKPHAEELMRTVTRCRQAAQDRRPAGGGTLQIAAALSICTYLLPDVLRRFRASHRKVLITVRSGHSKEVLDMVLRGEVELGIARSLHHAAVETVSLREDPLILVGDPLSVPKQPGRVRLEEVAERPLIFFDRGSSDWTLTQSLFRQAGLVPNVVMEVETIETAKRMVLRRMGLAFLPQLAVARDIQRRRLVAMEVADAGPPSRTLDVVHLRQRPLSGAGAELLATLREAAGVVGSPRAPRRRSRRRA